jgi:hypothetical protein
MGMLPRLALVLVVMVGLAGCAGRDFRQSTEAEPSAGLAALAGTWEGVVTGRELATTQEIVEVPARLIVDEDGRWTLVTRSGGSEQKSSGRLVTGRTGVSLEGAMEAGAAASPPVHCWLQLGGTQSLYGTANTILGGRRVVGGIQLRKVA